MNNIINLELNTSYLPTNCTKIEISILHEY